MLRFLCCCCSFSDNTADERRPLLQPSPSESASAESVRQTWTAQSGAEAVGRRGRLVMRRVGVSELDQRLYDVAETFNEQHGSYEAMVQHFSDLRQSCGCSPDGTLAFAECVRKIREEHHAEYRVSLQMKGYGFTLSVVPLESGTETDENPLPRRLQLAQEELKAASQSVKATISVGTKLQEMIGWLLRSEERMAEQVKEATGTYQEQRRLDENLKENMKEVRRAKELSLTYRQQAGEVFTEAATIAGVQM
ncbi:uncharacterized protein LOC143000455 isoform X2 [Genypterus blacodes]|uniref:uncharacterized protein LOC143000455 isoform X2 n=1 Tax=Genypterus blacodes TaxID=154954 RepID=UPI003F76E5D0